MASLGRVTVATPRPDSACGSGMSGPRIRVEPHAVERGCTHAWLTTFSFQAPEFYARFGYESFAVLEDHPKGHRHHFFQKRLVANEGSQRAGEPQTRGLRPA